MSLFTDEELRRATTLRDRANDGLRNKLDKLMGAKRGDVSRRLSWDTADIMGDDQLRAFWGQLIDMNGVKDSKATLESLINHLTGELVRWRPSHSSSPAANLENEVRRHTQQTILEELSGWHQLRLREEANKEAKQ